MNSSIPDNSTTTGNNVLQKTQVPTMPIGSGGNKTLKQQYNDLNVRLTMMNAQAKANTEFDPPVPEPVTKQKIIKESFVNVPDAILLQSLAVIGVLFVVYGFVSK